MPRQSLARAEPADRKQEPNRLRTAQIRTRALPRLIQPSRRPGMRHGRRWLRSIVKDEKAKQTLCVQDFDCGTAADRQVS